MVNKNSLKQWTRFIIIVLAFVILLTGLYIRLLSVRDDALEEQEQDTPTPVKAIKAGNEDVWLYKSALGRIEGNQSVTVFTEVGGWVTDIGFKRGDKVNKDSTIVTLEDQKTGYNLKESEGRLNSAIADLKEARRLYEQNKALFEKGIIARDTLESSLNRLKAGESTVNSLEAAYQREKWDYGQLKIKSPIEGTVVEIFPDIGQELQINDRVARIVNSSEKKVVAGVTSSIAKSIIPGTRVRIYPGGNSQVTYYRGDVTGISEDVDENSSLYSLEVKISDEENDLLPGEIITLQLPVEKLENVIRIPATSLYSDNGYYYVFISEDNKAKKIKVEEVRWINDNYAAVSPEYFPADTVIITEGSAALNNGDSLKIVE